MKLKVSTLFGAFLALTAIINEKRQMSQKGKYRIARMHEKLAPDFKVISDQRDALVAEFGEDETVTVKVEGEPDQVNPTGRKLVKQDSPNWQAYLDAWSKVAEEEIDVDVQPIPFELIDNIEAHELITLGTLIADPVE